MRYTLNDYTTNEKLVTEGTCELCMSTGIMKEQYFHFQDELGKTHVVAGFMWDWGDLFEIYIENIPHFAQWVSRQDIDPPYESEYGYEYDYSWLRDVVDMYREDCEMERIDHLWMERNVSLSDMNVEISIEGTSKCRIPDMEDLLQYIDVENSLGIRGDGKFVIPDGHSILTKGFGGISVGDEVYIDLYTTIDGEVSLGITLEGGSWRDYKSFDMEIGDLPATVLMEFSQPGELPEFSVK